MVGLSIALADLPRRQPPRQILRIFLHALRFDSGHFSYRDRLARRRLTYWRRDHRVLTTLLLTAVLLDASPMILGPALSLLPQAIVAGFWASVVSNAVTTTLVLLVASVIFDDFEFGNPFAFVLMLVMMVAVEIALRYLLSQTITVG
jgi:hypothetical protein